MILFLNFAPLSFAGGAERWMIDIASELKNKEEVRAVQMSDEIANVYSRLVLKRKFDNRKKLASWLKVHTITLTSLIPFTSAWHKIRKEISAARVIYAKYELNELLLLFYYGGKAALTKTVIGTHSPLLYEHSGLTFFEKLHNQIYLSRFSLSVLSLSKMVHVLNDSQEKLLKKSGLKNIVLIPNYVETTPSEPKKIDDDVLHVGFLGELSWRKGVDILIEVVKKSSPEFKFEIIGDGPGREAIRNLSSPLTTYHGYLNQSNISNILDTLDVLIQPSRAESFSLASLEAMSHGVVVTSSANITPESMKDLVEISETNSSEEYLKVLAKLKADKKSGVLKTMSKKVWMATNNRFSREKILKELQNKIFLK